MTFPLLTTIGGGALVGVGVLTSEFGFGIPLAAAGVAIMGGGALASAADNAGTEIGKNSSNILMIAAIGIVGYLILKKRGKI